MKENWFIEIGLKKKDPVWRITTKKLSNKEIRLVLDLLEGLK